MPAQLAHFGLQAFDLRLEPSGLLGEGLDGALLLVRLRGYAEGVAFKYFFKELDE